MRSYLIPCCGRALAVWLAGWLVGTAAARTQEPAAPPVQPVAAPADVLQSLNELARTWLEKERRYELAQTQKERTTFASERLVAKLAFAEAMANVDASRSRPLLLDGDAIRAVFANGCAPVAPAATIGTTTFVTDAGAVCAEFVPTAYDPLRSHTMILVIADREARASRQTLQDYLDTAWLAPEAGDAPILVAPLAPVDLDFDAPDEKPHPQEIEGRRVGAVLAPLGPAMQRLHIDRERMILDCGRGASAFGLRLAAMFPDRFAGVVLRWPVLDEGVRLEALTGLPILLVRCAATEAACAGLHERLNELAAGSCYVLTPRGEYPFAGEAGIGEWARQQRRDAMAQKVVLAPIHDRFNDNRWVRIDVAESIDPVRLAAGPQVTAEVDRKQNRITVQARGVKALTLLLGPALVDVREFTLVVNGSEQTVGLKPSLSFLVEQIMQRSDAGWLFTASHRVAVP